MPTCGHLMPWLGPLHRTPLLDPRSGRRWHGPSAGTWSWFLLQLGTFPPMPEVLLNWVEDLLMDILCHLCIAWVHTGCPLQLIHFIVYPLNLLPNHFRPDEFHGRRLHPHVSFGGGLSPVPVNGIMFFLPHGFGMSKHPMHYEWAMWPKGWPPQTFI